MRPVWSEELQSRIKLHEEEPNTQPRHCPRAQPPLIPPSAELSGTSVFSRTGSPQEERAGDLECFSPRTGPGKGQGQEIMGAQTPVLELLPISLPTFIQLTTTGTYLLPSPPHVEFCSPRPLIL